jgi:hypothetical protein
MADISLSVGNIVACDPPTECAKRVPETLGGWGPWTAMVIQDELDFVQLESKPVISCIS